MVFRNVSDEELILFRSKSHVREEIRRRDAIRTQRSLLFQRMPTQILLDRYERVLIRRGWVYVEFIIERNAAIATMEYDDNRRVRVVWRSNQDYAVYTSYGVSIMHAILIAQTEGMPYIDFPITFRWEHMTRLELGTIRMLERAQS